MKRIFTKDVGNHPKGKIADYPLGVWRHIANSAFMNLDDFTRPTEQTGIESMSETEKVSIARNKQPSGIKRGRGRPRRVPVGT